MQKRRKGSKSRVKIMAEELMKKEAGRGAGSGKLLGGEGSPSWGLSPGERPSGQRVVGGASTCQVVGSQGPGGGEHSVRYKRHQ